MQRIAVGILGVILVHGEVMAHPGHDDAPVSPPPRGSTLSNSLPGVPVLADDSLPSNEVKIEIKGGYRQITSNGIPDHAPGQFPNRNNPNVIKPQPQKYRMPAEPKVADKVTDARGHPFGIAINGVVFDPGTAEFWNNDRRLGWNLEAFDGPMNLGLDKHNAHVQPTGTYHYHALPIGVYERLKGDSKAKKMILVGWAADGFPIYGLNAYSKADDASSEVKELKSSWQLKKADRPAGEEGPGGKPDGRYTRDWEYVAGSGDLDECNGRTGVTPEFPKRTYYYMITDQFPYIPRFYRGTPDASFERRGPGGVTGGGRDRR